MHCHREETHTTGGGKRPDKRGGDEAGSLYCGTMKEKKIKHRMPRGGSNISHLQRETNEKWPISLS